MAANPMNDLYQAVCTSLATITASTINWFEIDMNQNTKEGEDLPLDYPAVIFKFHEVLWENSGLPRQGLVSMEAKVLHKIDENTGLMQPQANGRNDEIRRNTDLATINSKIEGLSSGSFN